MLDENGIFAILAPNRNTIVHILFRCLVAYIAFKTFYFFWFRCTCLCSNALKPIMFKSTDCIPIDIALLIGFVPCTVEFTEKRT